MKNERKKKKQFFVSKFEINLQFKKAQQLTVSNAFGCLLKFILKVGVEESIVNAPLVSLHSKNPKNAQSEVKFKQRIN
jgi:hypothetical protein